jgi:hypothetical protein
MTKLLMQKHSVEWECAYIMIFQLFIDYLRKMKVHMKHRNHIIFQHPVTLVNDFIAGAVLKVQLHVVLVDCWYAVLSLFFYRCYFYDMFRHYKVIIIIIG